MKTENKEASLPCAICGRNDNFRLISYNMDGPVYVICLKCIDKAKNKEDER